jgi:heat shock protein 5
LLAGATLGPLLDGIHSSVGLQIYDLWPADLGPLHTSAAVPALLSAFYLTLTLLDDAAERLSGNDSTPNPPTPLTIAACYASLAGGLALSAFLHANEVPPSQIAAALAIFAGFNFAAFDRTRRGLALALLCAVVAPLAEAQLMARFGTWHYPRADIEVPVLLSGLAFGSEAMTTPGSVGFISWVPLCYFFYAPSVLLLGRKLRAAERQRKRREG